MKQMKVLDKSVALQYHPLWHSPVVDSTTQDECKVADDKAEAEQLTNTKTSRTELGSSLIDEREISKREDRFHWMCINVDEFTKMWVTEYMWVNFKNVKEKGRKGADQFY